MPTRKKTPRSLIITALGLALLATSACNTSSRYATLPPAGSNQTSVGITPSANTTPTSDGLIATDPMKPAEWSDLKNLSFDQRFNFYAGFPTIEAKLDAQIASFGIKRAAMGTVIKRRAWDISLKELRNRREALHAASAEMSAAEQGNWQERLGRVGLAWQRTQDTVGKMNAMLPNSAPVRF